MDILVCRVAWMPHYRSDRELAVGGGRYVDEGYVPHESLNFLPVGDTYYGYVRYAGQNLGIERLGAARGDDSVSGILIVFCAEHRESGDFLVVGWYSDATVYRQRISRPESSRQVSFKANDATLVADSERCFRIPRAQDNPPGDIGGIGMSNIWYGLSNGAAQEYKEVNAFRDHLLAYIDASSTSLTPEKTTVESRRRGLSERLERRGSNRRFIERKGYRCEACDWWINGDDRAVWGSSFELHHLDPVCELSENKSREVCAEDFAVLCASCHRAIHRTEFVSDVAGFAAAYLRSDDDNGRR